MLNIERFDGGVSTRLRPHLIGTNQAVTALNVSIENGTLSPLKDSLDIHEEVEEKWFYDSKNQVTSSSSEEAYWAENIGNTYMIETNVTPLSKLNADGTLTLSSLEPPEEDSKPEVQANQSGGNMEAGTYTYAYTYYDIEDGRESKPTPISDDAVILAPEAPVTDTTDPTNTSLSGDARALLTIGRYINQVREGSGDFGNRVEALHCIWDKFTFTEQSNIDLQANATSIYLDSSLDAHQKFDALVALADATPEVSDASGSNESIHSRAYDVAFGAGSASSKVDQLNVIVNPTATAPTEDRDLFYYNLLSQTRASLNETPPAGNYADNDTQWHLVNAQCELQGEYTSGAGGGTVDEATPPPPPPEAHGSVLINNIIASEDEDVTNIRLYRIGGSLTEYTLVEELDNTDQQYLDTHAGVDIAGNQVLDTLDNNPAPIDGRFLTEFNTMLFLGVGSTLRFSDVASPDKWSEANSIEFGTDITGMGKVAGRLFVFTRNSTYLLNGNSPLTMTKHILDDDIGCINHYTVAFASSHLIWLGEKGIYASRGGAITSLTYERLGRLNIDMSVNAIGIDNRYYLSHSSGMLIAELTNGNVVFRCTDDKGWVGDKRADPYIAYQNKMYKMYSKGTKTMHYLSPVFTSGDISQSKAFKEIEVSFIGQIHMKVWMHNFTREREIVFDRELEITDLHDSVKIRYEGSLGYGTQVEITGTGEVLGLNFVQASNNRKVG